MDKIRIEHVILNLFTNAIKNTPSKGIIYISLTKNIDYIDIIIKDTGIGFTEDEREITFKKFGKIDRKIKGMNIITEGSGLGLYISKEIVKLHKGKVWLESEGRNKGSTFIVRLPVNEKKQSFNVTLAFFLYRTQYMHLLIIFFYNNSKIKISTIKAL